MPSLKILGIETSFDDTAVAIIDSTKKVLWKGSKCDKFMQKQFRGVVPTLAAESHRKNLPFLIERALNESNLKLQDINMIAATRGPGLSGSLKIGYDAGRLLSHANNCPLYPIHHMEAHTLMPRFEHCIEFPYLCLLVSGGHTMLVLAESVGSYSKLGGTIDDSVGESIDKLYSLLYPQWENLIDEKTAPGDILENLVVFTQEKIEESQDHIQQMENKKENFPLFKNDLSNINFSFSGVKAHFKRIIEKINPIKEHQKAFIAKEFLNVVFDHLIDRTRNGISYCINNSINITCLVLSGGVAGNKILQKRMSNLCNYHNIPMHVPSKEYCTDNGVMIAWAAYENSCKGSPLKTIPYDVLPEWNIEDLKLKDFDELAH